VKNKVNPDSADSRGRKKIHTNSIQKGKEKTEDTAVRKRKPAVGRGVQKRGAPDENKVLRERKEFGHKGSGRKTDGSRDDRHFGEKKGSGEGKALS